MMFTKIMNLFDRTEERQIRQLALAAEAKVHRLSGSDNRYFDREQDLILILTSIDRLKEFTANYQLPTPNPIVCLFMPLGTSFSG